MRTLTVTLQAAQAATSFRPYVRLTTRPATAAADRINPAQGPVPASTDTAACCAGGGALSVFALHAGRVQVTPYAGTPPVAGGVQTLWVDNGTLIAAAQLGSSQAVATAVPSNGFITVHTGTAGSMASATGENVFSSGMVAQAIACAYAPDGRLFVVAACTATLRVFVRIAPNSYTSYQLNYPPAATGQPQGVAACYTTAVTPGDLAVYLGQPNATLSQLVTALVGDGGLLAAGAFSALNPVLVTAPANLTSTPKTPGTTLYAAGACLLDTLRFTFYESFQNPNANVASKRAFQQIALTPQNVRDGYLAEPAPLPLDSPLPLGICRDATGTGATGNVYYANAATILYATPPSTIDRTARLLKATRVDDESGAHAAVLLDNADGSLTALAQSADTIGARLTLDFGYSTSAGSETSVPGAAPLWVSAVHAAACAGTRYLEFTAHDGWHLLAAWRPRRLYAWIPGQATTAQILQWILARAGLPFTPPTSPSVLLASKPAFNLKPGTSGAHAVHELLDQVPEVLLFTAAGAVLRLPQPTDPPVYAYTPSVHPVLASRLSQQPAPLNHVLLYGQARAGDTLPTLIAEAYDTTDANRIGSYPHIVHDRQVALANAAARAAVPLRKAGYITDAGEIATAPNAGLELWDAISITDAALSIAAVPYRVRTLHTEYDTHADGGVYTQSVGLMRL